MWVRQWGWDDIPYMKWKIKLMFETTNQALFLSSQLSFDHPCCAGGWQVLVASTQPIPPTKKGPLSQARESSQSLQMSPIFGLSDLSAIAVSLAVQRSSLESQGLLQLSQTVVTPTSLRKNSVKALMRFRRGKLTIPNALGNRETGQILGDTSFQWEFQDPKLEVLYHIRPYFVGIFPYIGLTNSFVASRYQITQQDMVPMDLTVHWIIAPWKGLFGMGMGSDNCRDFMLLSVATLQRAIAKYNNNI